MRVVLALTIMLVAGVAQAQGPALAWCEEERAGESEPAALGHTPPALAILPCALIDSGRVAAPGALDDGAPTACADSPFYVVTHAGVLLCQVDVELFSLADDDAVERAAPAQATSTTALHAATFVAAPQRLTPPGPVALLGRPVDARAGHARDGHTWRPPRPS